MSGIELPSTDPPADISDAHYILKQTYPLTNETLITALDEKIELVGAGTKCQIAFQQSGQRKYYLWTIGDNFFWGYWSAEDTKHLITFESDKLKFYQHLIPNVTDIKDLGSSTNKFRDIYLKDRVIANGKIIGGSKLYVGYTEAEGDAIGINGAFKGDMIAIGGYIGSSLDDTLNYYSAFYIDQSTKEAFFENAGGGIRLLPATSTDIRADISSGSKFRIKRKGMGTDYFDFFWATSSLAKILCNDAIEIESGANDDIILDSGSDRVKIEDFTNLKPSSAPASPLEGDVYFDSTAKKLKVYNGSAWETVTST